jgi:hyaluronan synthase
MLLDKIVMIYGIVALSHLFLQLSLAHFSELLKNKFDLTNHPHVAIVIPCYQEEPILFKKCVQSALSVDYAGQFHVFAIDDGSIDKSAFELVGKIKSEKLTLISIKQNVGKRKAQKYAFDMIGDKYDVIVTLDSDTVLDRDSVNQLVKHLIDKNIGAVTGYASVINRDYNLLTKLIYSRYWVAFNIERSAQSLFGAVMCCTGVLSAYRNDIIQDVKETYVSQTFLGKECTYGDDRNLTNLVLMKGYKTVYESQAIGWTDVPKNMKQYLKQQLRWNRSFYREMIITAKMIIMHPNRYSIYMIYDLIMQAMMPIALICCIIYMVYRVFSISYIYILSFVATVIGMALLRSFYAIVMTKDRNFLCFPIYSFIYLFLLIPLRIYALFSINGNGWGTR